MTKKKTKQQTARPQGQCIFCKGHGMTKQHVWPNWISRAGIYDVSTLPTNSTQIVNHLESYTQYGGQSSPTTFVGVNKPKVIHRQGGSLTYKLRLVCQQCNNGWMSRIEEESKDIVLRLQAHENVSVSPEEQAKLAAWIAQMTIVAEFTDIPTKTVPFSEREHFLQVHLPPAHWSIWVGKYQGTKWSLRYRHHALVLPDFDSGESGLENKKYIWQSSTFVVGGLILHSISTGSKFYQPHVEEYEELRRIWPPLDTAIDWSSVPIQSDDDVEVGSQVATSDMMAFVRELVDEALLGDKEID